MSLYIVAQSRLGVSDDGNWEQHRRLTYEMTRATSSHPNAPFVSLVRTSTRSPTVIVQRTLKKIKSPSSWSYK